jgi:hypothetical protein
MIAFGIRFLLTSAVCAEMALASDSALADDIPRPRYRLPTIKELPPIDLSKPLVNYGSFGHGASGSGRVVVPFTPSEGNSSAGIDRRLKNLREMPPMPPPEDDDCRSAKQALHNAIRAKQLFHLTHAQVEALSCRDAERKAYGYTDWESAQEKKDRERREQERREFDARMRQAALQAQEADGLIPPEPGPTNHEREFLGDEKSGFPGAGAGPSAVGSSNGPIDSAVTPIFDRASSQQKSNTHGRGKEPVSASGLREKAKHSMNEFREQMFGPNRAASGAGSKPRQPLKEAAQEQQEWKDVTDLIDFAETGRQPSRDGNSGREPDGSNAERAPRR